VGIVYGRAASVIALMALNCSLASAQAVCEVDEARLLANPSTEHPRVYEIIMSGNANVPALLSCARNPPPDVERDQLYVGLSDVFGRLRAKEGIPFLIENIDMCRSMSLCANAWLKADYVLKELKPAIMALIRIGPDASRALIHESWARKPRGDRMAALFVVSQIRGAPEARGFLTSAVNRRGFEHYWAEHCMQLLDREHE
jgi:hypothetical protein